MVLGLFLLVRKHLRFPGSKPAIIASNCIKGPTTHFEAESCHWCSR